MDYKGVSTTGECMFPAKHMASSNEVEETKV